MLKVWEMPQGKLQRSFRMDVPPVHCGSVSPSGRYFAGGSITGDLNVWGLDSGRIVQSFHLNAGYIRTVAWSPDESLIFMGFLDGTIIALRNMMLKK